MCLLFSIVFPRPQDDERQNHVEDQQHRSSAVSDNSNVTAAPETKKENHPPKVQPTSEQIMIAQLIEGNTHTRYVQYLSVIVTIWHK